MTGGLKKIEHPSLISASAFSTCGLWIECFLFLGNYFYVFILDLERIFLQGTADIENLGENFFIQVLCMKTKLLK